MGEYSDVHNLLPALEDVYQREQEEWRRHTEWHYDITLMTAAEIEAAVKHDIELIEAARQEPSTPGPEQDRGLEPDL